MQSRGFALAMGACAAVLVAVCAWLGLRFWKVYQLRQSFPKAVKLYNQGEFEAALPHVDNAITHSPTHIEPYRLGAAACVKLDQLDRARDYCTRMLPHASGLALANAHLHIGSLLLEDASLPKAQLDEAASHLEAAYKAFDELNEHAQAARAVILLADAHERRGDPKAAERCYQLALALPPKARSKGVGTRATVAEVAAKLRAGDTQSLVEAWHAATRNRRLLQDAPSLRPTVALALAFRAADPSLSSSVTRLCLQAMFAISAEARRQYAHPLHLLAYAAHARLGDEKKALTEARKAYAAAKSNAHARRALVHALFAVAAKSGSATERGKLEAEALPIARELLAAGTLPPDQKRQLTLAVATRDWNADRRSQALELVKGLAEPASPLVERMQATTALAQADYPALIAHLGKVKKLEGEKPDTAALLKRLSTPPDIYGFRANRLNKYDARPILAVSFAPRAVPMPIAADKVSLSLDGKPVQALVARGEAFYRPDADLPPGEHSVAVAVADGQGLQASKTFSFNVDPDTDPPVVVAISPEDSGHVNTLQPIVSFRCTDPSGIDGRSINVTFGAHFGDPPRAKQFTLIRKGIYQGPINTRKLRIAKGTHVEHGIVRFQPSKPLAPGKCKVTVSFADARGNKATREWTFECTR
ncbi:MAG: tetratricopeptide repeat protein [Candidatus Brocadiae bacterium]|nr:tetratricopeptide repeat protein [Candidatus Brocadiia bacterium]